ncbi:MAG: hypothetical protein HDT43_00875 [Ruminococcaceae bacterium]|nr:hypothetical protein [Oscillospiraceae bacterium]
MLIENKWVVYDSKDNVYYYGDDSDDRPVMGTLDSRVHRYKSEVGAKRAINHILKKGSERTEFSLLKPLYIQSQEVPDVPKDKPKCDLYNELHKLCDKYNISFGSESQGFGAELADLARRYPENIPEAPQDEPPEPPKTAVVANTSEWETVFACAAPPREPGGEAKFSKIALCRKQIGDREIFGVRALDGKLYSAGFDGGETALKRFLEEYYNYLLKRVTRGEKTLPLPCPICGKTHKENGSWAQCPKYKTSVCQEHCFKCEHFTDFGGTSIVRCLFPEKA